MRKHRIPKLIRIKYHDKGSNSIYSVYKLAFTAFFTGSPDKTKEHMVLSASQNFGTILHPFTVDKEWYKGFGGKDAKRFEGYVYGVLLMVYKYIS